MKNPLLSPKIVTWRIYEIEGELKLELPTVSS